MVSLLLYRSWRKAVLLFFKQNVLSLGITWGVKNTKTNKSQTMLINNSKITRIDSNSNTQSEHNVNFCSNRDLLYKVLWGNRKEWLTLFQKPRTTSKKWWSWARIIWRKLKRHFRLREYSAWVLRCANEQCLDNSQQFITDVKG